MMKHGLDCFGPQYGIMYRNDTHADGSVDRVLIERMIKLDECSVDFLYGSYTDLARRYEMGSRKSLEKIAARLKQKKDSKTINAIVAYCRKLVRKCNTRSEDMIYGGTEEEIVARGTYWCTDIARVACVLFQMADIPSRILVTANTNFAYCGHSVAEVFHDGQWTVVDPTNGVVIPGSAWEIHNSPEIANRVFYEKYPKWKDFFPPGEQYESVGVVNYYVDEHEQHSYEVSRVNEYCREILRHSATRWAGGIRWIHGEDLI